MYIHNTYLLEHHQVHLLLGALRSAIRARDHPLLLGTLLAQKLDEKEDQAGARVDGGEVEQGLRGGLPGHRGGFARGLARQAMRRRQLEQDAQEALRRLVAPW